MGRQLLITLLVCLLTACGGGGGGSSSRDPVAPAPEDPAPPPQPDPPPEPDPEDPPLQPPENPGPREPETTWRVTGTATVASNLWADGDTNDPGNPAVANDSPATAQPIGNPVTLGGYVNEPGAGDAGRSQAAGDREDFFRVDLLAGQTVTLLVAEAPASDVDLFLLDEAGATVDFSITTGEIERLTVPADGSYLINVSIFAGASNYTLAIGASTAPQSFAADSADFVPWQAVVKYRDIPSPQGLDLAEEDLAWRMGMARRAGSANRPRLMALQQAALQQHQLQNRLGASSHKLASMVDPALRARWETTMTIKSLNRDPAVAWAEPNYRLRPLLVPNDEAYAFQWHYPVINLPAAWDLSTGSPEVVVAVVDTGILANHPDLVGQLVDGYDFISDIGEAADGDGIDPDPHDSGSGSGPGSSSFHGTHVAGTIAAATDNGIGIAGVAWNARIMPLRVLGAIGGTSYDIAQAVRFAAGLPNDSGTTPSQRADIINLSLGGGFFSQASQQAYTDARNAGVIVVAAAGNEASSNASYPAAYDGVISVSAVDLQRRSAPYSNFGASVDIAAPGGNNGLDFNGDGYPDGVLSTDGTLDDSGLSFEYSFLNGTSMSSPHVAGVLALMKSVNPDLTPADIDALLETGQMSDDAGAPGRDDFFGHGIINAQLAVTAAASAAGSPPADNPRLGASSTSLSFNSATNNLDLLLQNLGNGELELQSITPSAPWLQVVALDADAAGLGLYRVEVDRADLAPGIYGGTITLVTNVNTLVIEVLLSVAGEATGGNVGTMYLLLYEFGSNTFVDQVVAQSENGEYHFEFDKVPEGRYELLAGSDADNDLFICDTGEACGAYLTIDQPLALEVDRDLEGIEFPVEFLVTIPTVAPQASQQQEREGVRRR